MSGERASNRQASFCGETASVENCRVTSRRPRRAGRSSSRSVYWCGMPLAHRVGEFSAEKPDEQFEDRFALPGELRHGPGIDADVPRHGQHVDQTVAQDGVIHLGLTRAFDLRQDFKLAAVRGDHTDHAASAQRFSAVFQHSFAAAPGEYRYSRLRDEPICMRLRDLGVTGAIADTLPFADGTADHVSVSAV